MIIWLIRWISVIEKISIIKSVFIQTIIILWKIGLMSDITVLFILSKI